MNVYTFMDKSTAWLLSEKIQSYIAFFYVIIKVLKLAQRSQDIPKINANIK